MLITKECIKGIIHPKKNMSSLLDLKLSQTKSFFVLLNIKEDFFWSIDGAQTVFDPYCFP